MLAHVRLHAPSTREAGDPGLAHKARQGMATKGTGQQGARGTPLEVKVKLLTLTACVDLDVTGTDPPATPTATTITATEVTQVNDMIGDGLGHDLQ